MARPTTENGFTLLESMLVLLVVCISLSLSVPTRRSSSLSIFMKDLEQRLLQAQAMAYSKSEPYRCEIRELSLNVNGSLIQFPEGIACSPMEFSFNEKGGVSKAGTIICTSADRSARLVITLGSRRMRIEEE